MQSSDVFHFLSVVLEKAGGLKPARAGDLAGQFSTLESFAKTDFASAVLSRADGGQVRLNDRERKGAETAKSHVRPSSSLNENWIRFITHRTIDKMMKNVNSLRISDINMNPFLIRVLRLRHPDEAVRFNVYQTVTRSLVTTMGNTLQYMLGSSGGARLGKKGEWYDVIKEKGDDTYWIQVKAGPNNVNADQAKDFTRKFDETEKTSGNFARLGIAYGKRDLKTVSLEIVKNYVDKWDERLLVGAELWDFVSGEKDYHLSVLRWIDLTADQILENSSIMREVENAVERLIGEFEAEYGKGEQAMQKYLNASL